MSQTNQVTTTSGTPSAPMTPQLVVVLLSLLLGIQPITTDLYLPALPSLTQDLSGSMMQAQLTLTALSLAFGVSQLFWGPLSDRFGRRPILVWGMVFFTLSSIGSTIAPTFELLIVWRAVQGAAMGAAVSTARAIVRDLYAPIEGARAMSKGLTGLGVIACLSGPVGAATSYYYGWRTAMGCIVVYGLIITIVLAKHFVETNPYKNPRALSLSVLTGNWVFIAKTPTFWAYTALSIAAYSALFTFLAGSSFVFLEILKISKLELGATMLAISIAYIGGTFLCRRLIVRWGIQRTLRMGGFITLGAGTAMGALPLVGVVGYWSIMVPLLVLLVGHGIHQPCGQSGAVSPFPRMAGAAAALNGFLMMVSAFAVGTWLGDAMDGTVQPMTSGIWFWTVCIAASVWFLVPKWGDLGTPPKGPTPPTRVTPNSSAGVVKP